MDKRKAMAAIRDGRSRGGFLTSYLAWMRAENPEGAETLEVDLMEVFGSTEGLRVLKLFEKSVLFSEVPNGSEDRALREGNAVRNFVLEIRRIVSHGTSTQKTN